MFSVFGAKKPSKEGERRFCQMCVSFLSSLRAQTAKTSICTKSGASADARKSAKKCRKVRNTAFFAHFLRKKKCCFPHFSSLFATLSCIGGNPLSYADLCFCRLGSKARQEIHKNRTVFAPCGGGSNLASSPEIIYVAKASFPAYVLVKNFFKTGEKVHFSTKKSTTNFGLPFCSFPFLFLPQNG